MKAIRPPYETRADIVACEPSELALKHARRIVPKTWPEDVLRVARIIDEAIQEHFAVVEFTETSQIQPMPYPEDR